MCVCSVCGIAVWNSCTHMFIHLNLLLADIQEREGTYLHQSEMRLLVPELPSNHVYCLYHMETL